MTPIRHPMRHVLEEKAISKYKNVIENGPYYMESV